MTNSQVAEMFVDGRAGKSGTMSSDGEILKSYETPVARRVVKGKASILALRPNGITGSQTSKKHLGLVSVAAVRAGIPVVPVGNLDQPTPIEDLDEGVCEHCHSCGSFLDPDKPWCCPEEGDYTTEDFKTFYQYGKPVVEVFGDPHDEFLEKMCKTELKDYPTETPPAWMVYVMRHMRGNDFYPNVWSISDHGNAHLIDMTK